MNDELLYELLELEHQGWQSLCDGSGADFYGRIMTDEGAMILAHGFVFDRDAVIDSLAQAPTWDGYEIDAPEAIALGEDQAILRYTGTGHRAGNPDFHALMGSVYVRTDGVWRLVHYQQTPIPER
ncbi:MAG: nuclear transport factor 2 family protein [Micrococcaceae bacterium]|nr:nuclear transport factor 2 family protein [Micrococcaceae bacterium]